MHGHALKPHQGESLSDHHFFISMSFEEPFVVEDNRKFPAAYEIAAGPVRIAAGNSTGSLAYGRKAIAKALKIKNIKYSIN